MRSLLCRSWMLMVALAAPGLGLTGAGCGAQDQPNPNLKVQRIACSISEDCAARGGSCVSAVCVAQNECTGDADCSAGATCRSDVNFGGLCTAPGASPKPLPIPALPSPSKPPPPPPPPPAKEICDNRVDDDGDGLADCADPDCAKVAPCAKPSACDLFAQNCPTGARCWPMGNLAAQGQCYPIGPRGLGQTCEEPPVDGPQACGKGLLCVAADDQPTTPATCRPLCGPSKPCAAGSDCHALDFGGGDKSKDFGVCVPTPPPPPPPPPPPCDLFKQSCTSGQMCVAQKAGASKCIAAGTGKPGVACASDGDCAPGSQCMSLAGMSPPSTYYFGFASGRDDYCMVLCLPGGAACAGGATCSPVISLTGTVRNDVGVCFTP